MILPFETIETNIKPKPPQGKKVIKALKLLDRIQEEPKNFDCSDNPNFDRLISELRKIIES